MSFENWVAIYSVGLLLAGLILSIPMKKGWNDD